MRVLSKKEMQGIKARYKWPLSYLIIDVLKEFGDKANSLDDDIDMVITWYHNALRANWGETK